MFFNFGKFNIRALFNNKTKRNKAAANKLKAEENKLADRLANNAFKILKEYNIKPKHKAIKNRTMKKKRSLITTFEHGFVMGGRER
jgi:hypothetical protein